MSMREQLSRCARLCESLLSEFGRPATVQAVSQDSFVFISTFADAGIPRVEDSIVPPVISLALHDSIQQHFRSACMDLLRTPRHPQMAPLQTIAHQLRASFFAMYEQKVGQAANLIQRRKARSQKQPYATDILIYAYDQSQTPTKREREQLAILTGMTLEQVRVWFQNRRQRMKKRAPELQPRSSLNLEDLLARVAATTKPADCDDDGDFDDNDSGYCSDQDHTPAVPRAPASLTVLATGLRSYPAPYTQHDLATQFYCEPPVFSRTAAVLPPVHAQTTSMSELTRLMARLTLRHRRQTPRSSTGSAASAVSSNAVPSVKGKKSATNTVVAQATGETPRRKAARKDPETGRKVAGRRTASAASATSPALSSSTSPPPAPTAPRVSADAPTVPRKRLGPLRRKPVGKALARQASGSSVVSTSSSDSSRSTSYSSDFSLASDSSFTSVESAPTAASMECFQPQQQSQFDPLAAFDFTQLFSSQPSDILPQPVADFELPPDLLAGLQMPMDTAALPPPESTDFLALLNDPTIQDLLQSVQDMDVVAPQQMQESSTFNNTLDFGSVDTNAFLDLSASTLPTFDAMFGLDTSSFQDTLWNSPGFSLPITA